MNLEQKRSELQAQLKSLLELIESLYDQAERFEKQSLQLEGAIMLLNDQINEPKEQPIEQEKVN
jgi:hypothetical protein